MTLPLTHALEQFSLEGGLADQLILARASNTGALPLLSFDRRFSACTGVELLRSRCVLPAPLST